MATSRGKAKSSKGSSKAGPKVPTAPQPGEIDGSSLGGAMKQAHKQAQKEKEAAAALAQKSAAALELAQSLDRADAHGRAELGALLRSVKDAMAHGEWIAWIERHTPFSRRAVQDYQALAQFAQSQPALFQDIAHLGVTKLYALLRLEPPASAKLAKMRAISIPGTQRKKPLALLSSRELLAVIRALLGIEKEEPTLLERAKRRLTGFLAALTSFLAAPQVPIDEALAMRNTLREAVDELEDAYALPP